MGRRTRIATFTALGLLLLGAVGGYAYDRSQRGTIAEGISIGGVDVGGMSAAEASRAVRGRLLQPLRHSLRVRFGGRTWDLSDNRLHVHADLGGAVDAALAASREGGVLGRLVRDVDGSGVERRIPAGVTFSHAAVDGFVGEIAAAIDRKPHDAGVNATAASLRFVPGRDGRKVLRSVLRRRLDEAVLDAAAPHTIVAPVRRALPRLRSRSEVAAQYPSYLTLDRSTFTLRLWKHLKLAHSYTVAVGREGLETPAGLYHIEEKQVNPSWHVPNSAWAGSLAGKVIPPGPEDPIKARWMAIFEGAGIHGTEETWSLGHAVSHGCVRMSIPDVEELYPQVEVGTPIFIG